MGVYICCSQKSTIEEIIKKHLNGLKIKTMNCEIVKNILQGDVYTKVNCNRELSTKAKENLKNSLNKISKENFLQLSITHFINSDDDPSHINTHQIFLQKIYDVSETDISKILINLLAYMKHSNFLDKRNDFLNLIRSITNIADITYINFKNSLSFYIKNLLKLPIESLIESLNNSESSQDIKNEISELSNGLYCDKNIEVYIDSFFEDFEKKNFTRDSLEKKTFIMNDKEIDEILLKHVKNIFEMSQLRDHFNSIYY